MGEDISALVEMHLLSWIPAHIPYAAVGERMLPCGRRLTDLDWRANRLVDALAKMGAAAQKAREGNEQLLMSTAALATHNAAQLGQVTFIANMFSQNYTDEDGNEKIRIIRDSTPKPRGVHTPNPLPCQPHPATTQAQAQTPSGYDEVGGTMD